MKKDWLDSLKMIYVYMLTIMASIGILILLSQLEVDDLIVNLYMIAIVLTIIVIAIFPYLILKKIGPSNTSEDPTAILPLPKRDLFYRGMTQWIVAASLYIIVIVGISISIQFSTGGYIVNSIGSAILQYLTLFYGIVCLVFQLMSSELLKQFYRVSKFITVPLIILVNYFILAIYLFSSTIGLLYLMLIHSIISFVPFMLLFRKIEEIRK